MSSAGSRKSSSVVACHVRAAVLCLAALSTSSCRSVREPELLGVYSANADWGKLTLLLRKDHTMEQTVVEKNGRVDRVSGTWEFKSDSGDRIILAPCLEFTHTPPAGYGGACDYGVGGFLNGVEISTDPDFGVAYRK